MLKPCFDIATGKYGYVDTETGAKIDPQFEEASDFRDGLARVRKPGGHYYFIDTSGQPPPRTNLLGRRGESPYFVRQVS